MRNRRRYLNTSLSFLGMLKFYFFTSVVGRAPHSGAANDIGVVVGV